jgi:lysozyme
MSIDFEKLTAELKVDEGFRGKVYKCSAGKLTIGYGWNLEDSELPERIAEMMLSYAVGDKLQSLERLSWWCGLNDARKRAIVNMSFNIGVAGVLKFKKMIAAIEREDFSQAALEMDDSKWSKQVGARADRLILMMNRGY